MKTITKLWIGLAVLIVLSPLGIIVPAHFKAGSAWGEWGAVTRYGVANVSYMLSAVGGVAVIVAAAFIIGKILSGGNFIERSIVGALSFLKESLFADEYAAKKGFLQSLDPRVKMISLLAFIVQALLTKNIIIVASLYAFCLVLAGASRIPLRFFLKRTWVFIPLFSLFIAVPALFSIFTPGEAVYTVPVAGLRLIITRQGLLGASLFVLRVVTSVSFAVLLSITTKHFELLKVLRIFRIPQVFVMTLGMCYRYVFLFVETIENTYLAIKSRVGSITHSNRGRHVVAWNIATLWQRSYQLNDDVYKAMLSRGYRGDPVVLNEFKTRPRDWFWSTFVVWILFFLN